MSLTSERPGAPAGGPQPPLDPFADIGDDILDDRADALPRADTTPAGQLRRTTGRQLALVGALILAGALAFALFRFWPRTTKLEVDGHPISNAKQLLMEAEAAFRTAAEADAAPVPTGAGCWFAPPLQKKDKRGPRIACGPINLGVAGPGEDWLVSQPSYSPTGTNASARAVTGRFRDFDAVAAVASGELSRPDGKKPPKAPAAAPPTGLRTEQGQHLLRLDKALADADTEFRQEAARAAASVGPQSRCYFGYTGIDRKISDERLWCGPVLNSDSQQDAAWVFRHIPVTPGKLLTAAVGAIAIDELKSTGTLPAGTLLYRPDGAAPPQGTGGLAAPDAAAKVAGYVEVMNALPEAPTLATPADGRLVTPQFSTRIVGLGRLKKLGSGQRALVPAQGEELVVTHLQRGAGEPGGGSGRGTATLVVDGQRTALPAWTALRDDGYLVVSVPQGASSVDLEVLSLGRAQTISLLTGERAPGFPKTFYRQRTATGLGLPVEVSVKLPVGKPARVNGVLTEARLDAWRKDDGYAPVGNAFLQVSVDEWNSDLPCCDLTNTRVLPRWRLVLPDRTTVEAAAGTEPLTGSLVFLVPEDLTSARLELVVDVAFSRDGKPGRASSTTVTFPIEFPA